MIPTKKLSANNLQPESNLGEQFSLQSFKGNDAAQNRIVTNNFCFKLGISISLATAINLPDIDRVAQAADLDYLQTANSDRTANQSLLRTQSKITNFLPRILSLIPFSNQSKITGAIKSQNTSTPTKQVNLPPLEQKNRLANRETSPAARSSVRQPLRTHRVQRGDTINRIAQTYRVSSQELVKLNQIKNSNIIFVGQELKIPPTAIGGISFDPSQQLAPGFSATNNSPGNEQNLPLASDLSSSPESTTLDNNQSPELNREELIAAGEVEDPYIAGLRADIELMRARFRQQNQSESDASTPISLVDESPNVAAPRLQKNPKSTTPRGTKTTAKLDLPPLSSPLETNFFEEEEEIVALTLPPLPDSEEYLPKGFEGYIWPAEGILTSGYGMRWGRLHRGIDIAAPIGTPILAAAAGEVISVGWQSGYGNLVKLEHLDGSVTLYAHNNRNLVSHGQRVSQGEQIAEMGSTGYSTGPHLHFEIHTSDRKVINPLALLSKR